VAVAVLVGDDSGVLLVRRNIDPGMGLWSFPAGYVNRGEVLEAAAVREFQEELGVAPQLTALVGVYSAHEDPVVLVVYAGTIDGEPRPDNHEVSEVGRFPPDDLPEFAFKHDRRIIDDWKRARRG
jgi:8-oxo-dGTP diphosphatase